MKLHKKARRCRTTAPGIFTIIMVLVIGFVAAVPAVHGLELTADQLIEEAESVLSPASYYYEMSITTEKPGGSDRTLEMEGYYKEGSGSYIELTGPARSRGIRFLELDDALYMFNPRSNSRRAIRLSPKASFQGTVFSNNDVSDPDYSANYDSRIEGTLRLDHPQLGTVEVIKLIAEAKKQTAPYDKLIMYILPDTYIPVKIDYFAKSGLHFKEMELYDIREMAGRQRPTTWKMRSLEQQDTYSIVTLENMELQDIPDSQFTRQRLTR